jgi:Holliday junction DNA helicase RuvA
MIAKLRGLVDGQGEDYVILDVQGVGYLVQCSARTLHGLPSQGESTSLLIETQVREDAIRLFGFTTHAEKDWFNLLQNVQGVGARVALAIMGILSPDQLTAAIMTQDKTALSRAQGVGPKLAARIVAELKDKTPAMVLADTGTTGSSRIEPGLPGQAGAMRDAVSALVNLGYGASAAMIAIQTCLKAGGSDEPLETGELIRRGLKELTRQSAG